MSIRDRAREEAWLLENRLSATPPAQAAPSLPAGAQAQPRSAVPSGHVVSGSPGLALSGGGIRSATFNLGLLQALAAQGLLKPFGYLSTVSGGGYIGSFLGRLYHRASEENIKASPLAVAQDVERKLASDEAPIIRWLRDNGRYLAPHGGKDRRFAAAVYLRNLLSVHVFLAVIFFSAFMLLAWLRSAFTATAAPELVQAAEPHYEAGPLWSLAVLALMLFISSAWSYWMVRRDKGCAWFQVFVALALAAGPLALLWFTDAGCPALGSPPTVFWHECQPRGRGLLMLAGTALATLPILLLTRLGSDSLAHARNRLSKLSSRLLLYLFASSGLALLDDLALLTLRVVENKTDLPLLGAGLTGALLTALRALATHLSSGVNKLGNSTAGRSLKGVIGVVGVALMTLVAFGWAVAAYGVAGSKLSQQIPLGWLALAAAFILLLMFAIYRGNLDFLNLSSLHQFYAARLTRAYLGAGNRRRDIAWSETPVRGSGQKPVSDVVEGDDMPMGSGGSKGEPAYAPHRHGGPLHLINVNVNQTRYSATGNFQPDRKGWNMAVGPAGFNLGRTFWRAAGWREAEALSLGCWVSISGAAFSTGAGPRTGLGFSALLGLLGVRLGYWWRSGSGEKTSTPTTAGALMDEFTANFNPDKYRYWYLSDGGHFENTAAYELIRRKLKQIVVADCGADPDYSFDDLTNLVLKARIDFDAEIEFFGDADLDTLWSNTPWRTAFFAPALGLPRSGAALALARVGYRDDPEPGWLLLVKPRLLPDLPADLAHYADSAPSFPQQSTADQFYDEAQWESTRKLGRLIGGQLAGPLAALPQAWQDYLAAHPGFTGTDWSRPPPPKPAEDSPKPVGTAKLVALYTPIVIALWTGFEFYSNYQKSQATAAEERVKFVLSRIDVLEKKADEKPLCGTRTSDCPTAAGQLEMLRRELADLALIKPEKAKSLLEITDKLASALGLDRPLAGAATGGASARGELSTAGAAAGSPTSAPHSGSDQPAAAGQTHAPTPPAPTPAAPDAPVATPP
ncbi:hypothetical protein GPA19_24650, partial [Azoarcus indigens]|nr:hypothetical protein [Azoarcus indigens]